MKIRVKPMGVFRTSGAEGGVWEVPEGTTIAQAIDRLGVLPDQVHSCTLNDSIERDLQRPLVEGDELVILPPVVGG